MTGARSPWLDNAKGVLIVLVIWGHLIEQVALSSPLVAGAYGAIYLFHIPAFVMISGMVSSGYLDRQAFWRIGSTLLVPLVVFQALYWPKLAWLSPGRIGDPLTPHWILWFLLSLATWRLILPVFKALRFPVLTATGLALAAGFVGGIDHTLSLSRTFVFFPAFLVGHIYRAQIEAVTIRIGRGGAVLFFLFVGTAGYLVASGASFVPLYGSTPYANLSGDPWVCAAERLAIIGAGIVASIAFLSCVPSQSGSLTLVGRHSLPVFLLHGFVVLILWAAMPTDTATHGAGFLALNVMLAVLIAVGLSYVQTWSLANGWALRFKG